MKPRGSRPPARSDAEQLAWALRFAQADPSEWRDGDWLNAYEEALQFISEGQEPAESQATGLPARNVDRARGVLAPALGDLWKFLEGVDRARSDQAAPLAASKVPSVPFTGECQYLVTRPAPTRAQVVYAPSERDPAKRLSTQLRLRAGDLLTRVDLRRMKRCPECGTLFIATRRQRFDTAQCSLRDRVRRFRSKSRRPRKRPRARPA
jgi:hypothetical protein